MTIDAGEIPELLNWYEGMLLMPWHFQQSAQRHERLAGWLAEAAAPHGWGVRMLKSHLSSAGEFHLDELEAAMPDRMMVRYRATHDKPLSIKIGDKFTQEKTRVCVQLVAVKWTSDTLGPGQSARYEKAPSAGAKGEEAAAARAPDDPLVETPWLRPVLQLEATESPLHAPPARYVGLPLACFILRDGLVVHSDYQPPSLTLRTEQLRLGQPKAETPILDRANEVRKELVGKATFLSGRLPASALATNGLQPAVAEPKDFDKLSDMKLAELVKQAFEAQALRQSLSDLNAVTRTLPRLNALIEDPATHPHAVFLALCDILGDLSTLNRAYRLPDPLPTYDHRDALESFRAAASKISRILESLNQKYRAIPFERDPAADGARFILKDRPRDLGKPFTLCAVPGPGRDEATIIHWMDNAVIATEQEAKNLKGERAGGAQRKAIARDDALDVATTPERKLYSANDLHNDIADDDTTLVVEGMDKVGPAELYLYVAGDAKTRSGP